MISKVRIQPPIKQRKADGEVPQKWKKTLFFGHHNQYRCGTIIGSQGSGKSQLIINMINEMCDKKKSNIYWFSSLTNGRINLDQKITDLSKQFNVQFFTQEDVNNNAIKILYDHLFEKRRKELEPPEKPQIMEQTYIGFGKYNQQKNPFSQQQKQIIEEYKEELKEYKKAQKENKEDKYYKNVIIFDDILLGKKQQDQMAQICKNYRHIKACIWLLSQSPAQQSYTQLREIMNCHILFAGITNKRLEQLYWPELKININKDVFCQMYRWATEKKHHFFVIDNRQVPSIFQENFETVLIATEDDEDDR